MAEGRERSEWSRTSALLALIANAHRDAKKTRAFKPSDFDPFARRGGEKMNDTAALKALLTGRHETGGMRLEEEASETEAASEGSPPASGLKPPACKEVNDGA